MTKVGVFLAGFVTAALAAAGAWWFVGRPATQAAEERAIVAERIALRARRDLSDTQQWAEAERKRKDELEEEVTTLKRALSAGPPPAPSMGGHDTPAPDTRELPPEQWDGSRLRQEIDMLSGAPSRLVGSPRYPLVIRALKAHGDESIDLLTAVLRSDLPDAMKSVCASLLGALESPRGVKPLLAAWQSAADPDLRRSVLRGLANLDGDEQAPILTAVWNDPAADATMRLVAIHGLARRRDRIAMEVAAGGAPGSTPPLRMQALRTLHAGALRNEWKETALVPLLGKALLTADGDSQRRVALLALEGFWSKDSVADLETFAGTAGVNVDLAARARKAADAIKAGRPKPDRSGVPEKRPGASPVDGEPSDPDAPPPEPPQGEK